MLMLFFLFIRLNYPKNIYVQNEKLVILWRLLYKLCLKIFVAIVIFTLNLYFIYIFLFSGSCMFFIIIFATFKPEIGNVFVLETFVIFVSIHIYLCCWNVKEWSIIDFSKFNWFCFNVVRCGGLRQDIFRGRHKRDFIMHNACIKILGMLCRH